MKHIFVFVSGVYSNHISSNRNFYHGKMRQLLIFGKRTTKAVSRGGLESVETLSNTDKLNDLCPQFHLPSETV